MHPLLDPSVWLPSLLVWSAQVALLAASGWLASLAIQHPKIRMAMWQGVLLLALLLPLVEPWKTPPVLDVSTDRVAVSVSLSTVVPHSSGFHWRAEYWLWLIAAGAAIRMLLLLAGLTRLRRYRMQAHPLPGPPLRFASAVASWYASDSISSPVTYGWRRPVILLPSRAIELPAELCEAIQCHELIHVRRGDWLWVVGETVVRGLLWFHPAIWFLTSRIQLAREQVVDREAVGLLQNRERYLDALVAVASFGVRSAPLSSELAPAFLRKRHLVARVKAVAKEIPMSRARIAAGIAAASSVVSVAGLAAMWLFPFTSAPHAEAQTAPDSPGVTVDAGAPLLHRAAVRVQPALTGTVILQATIDSKGEVSDARVVSGPDELRKPALTSVLQWHYAPGPSTAQVSIQFGSAAAPAVATPGPSPTAFGPPVRQSVTVTPSHAGQPAQPRPPVLPAKVQAIEFQGLSPEAEQQVRSSLNVREGDTMTSEDFAKLNASLRSIDNHLRAMFDPDIAADGSSQVTLQIRVMMPQAAPPPPPPPPPGAILPTGQGQIRQSQEVQATKVIYAPKPAYPPIAKQARIQGSVLLNAVIAKDGTIAQLSLVSSSNPLLTPAAMDAVKQWVYQPTLLNGEAVDVVTQITINFALQ